MRKITILFLGIFVLLAFGCGVNYEVGGADYNTIKTCVQPVEYKGCTDDLSTFATDTPEIFATMNYKDGKQGDKFNSEWYFEDGTKFANYTVTLDKDYDPLLVFSVTKPDAGWPAGSYEFKVFKNDEEEVVSTKAFIIENKLD